jgi:hypothetical protein
MGSPLPVSALDPFLEVLRDNRFPVGLSHRLRLLQALDAWQGDYAPHRLRTLLCPIFASNAGEQRLFYDLFEQHLPHFANTATVTQTEVGGAGPSEAESARGKGRRLRWIIAAVAAVALIAITLTLMAFGIWPFRGHRAAPLAPTVPPASQTRILPHQQQALQNQQPIQPSKPGSKWRWTGLLLIPFVLWGLFEAWAWYRRRALVERGPSEPITDLVFRRVVLPVRTTAQAGFAAPLQRLRRPTPGPLRLHLGKTVASTIRAYGFPEFRYEPVFRRPEYLVLIDRVSVRDHQAAFFEELVNDLDRRGLRVAAYNFSGDPRVCRPVKPGRSVYLADLSCRAADHRLIVFGEGDQLLSDRGDVAPPGRLLLRWYQRGILTPREPQQWGLREFQLARHFLLLQATSESLAASVDYFDPDHNVRLRPPQSKFDHRDPDLDRAKPSEIRRVLGDDALYHWLCACALYPQLQWDVTLQLGAKIAPDLLRETNLERLVRLPWFRRGSIPVSLQQALAESLDVHQRRRLREAILELFQSAPRPPEGHAGDAHRLEIAIQQLDILPEERRRILEDEAVARVVAAAEVPPGALVASPALRRALFPLGLPALGLRAAVRRVLALFGGLAIVCVVGLAVYPWVRQKQQSADRAGSGQSTAQGSARTPPAAIQQTARETPRLAPETLQPTGPSLPSKDSGYLSGVVRTSDGKPVVRAEVTLVGVGTRITTDSGQFGFALPPALKPGDPFELVVAGWSILSPLNGLTYIPAQKNERIQITVVRVARLLKEAQSPEKPKQSPPGQEELNAQQKSAGSGETSPAVSSGSAQSPTNPVAQQVGNSTVQSIAAINQQPQTGVPSPPQQTQAPNVTGTAQPKLVASIASPDGRFTVELLADGALHLFDSERKNPGPPPFSFRTDDPATSAAFSPDSKLLALGTRSGACEVFDVMTGNRTLLIPGASGPVTALAFSPKGHLLATADEKTVRLWSLSGGQELGNWSLRAPVSALRFSPDGNQIITVGPDQSTTTYDLRPAPPSSLSATPH